MRPTDPAHPARFEAFCVHDSPHEIYRVRAERDQGATLSAERARRLATDSRPDAGQSNLQVEPADLPIGVPSYRADYDVHVSTGRDHIRTYLFDSFTHYELSTSSADLATFDQFAHAFRLNVSHASKETAADFIVAEVVSLVVAGLLVCGAVVVWLVRRRAARPAARY